MINKNENSTDATRGSSLRSRVETRKHELELMLATLGPDDRARNDIQMALNEVTPLLTGDLTHIPQVVAAQLNTWLEAAKHVAESHPGKKARASNKKLSLKH